MEFELNIYGENDEIIKTFSTDKVRWGVFLQAFEVQERMAKKSAREKVETVSAFMVKLFPSITKADLENADVEDIFNNFNQLLRKAAKIVNESKKKEVGGE